MKRELWFYKILKWFGLIKEYEIDKRTMCDNAKSICNRRCENCVWEVYPGVRFFDGGEEHMG